MAQSATRTAISLPEILSAVLRNLYEDFKMGGDISIVACTRVASSWEFEANRYLWERCSMLRRPYNPEIRDLVKIEARRQQKYANYIRLLSFSSREDCWEGSCHVQIAHLSFLRLERLFLKGPGCLEIFQLDTTSPTTYLHPGLAEISIQTFQEPASLAISNEFVVGVATCCSALQQLDLNINHGGHNVSTEALGLVAQNCHRLTSLSLGAGLSTQMSLELFRILADCVSLQYLIVPELREDWTEHLCSGNVLPGEIFTSLHRLECRASSRALNQFLQFLLGLRMLDIEAQGGASTDMLDVIVKAGLTQLVELRLQLISNTIAQGPLLLQLAECNPNLHEISITCEQNGGSSLTIEDLDDAKIEQIVACLPQFTEIELSFNNKALTETSLLSLGLHCPFLRNCRLTAKMNFAKLVNEAPQGLWRELWDLTLESPVSGEGEEDQARAMTAETTQDIAKKLCALMPSLDMIHLQSDPDLEQTVDDLLHGTSSGSS
ncbi:hypothetical protein K461DRAFT_298099 [Myriangium duriaei CBS 260.36]|uniref:Uncharacterized protein n=1 Tax=Myriangium duriaei CBS 260.36 TaxID=1168546 RepID=A0A9P4IUC2_9PEZI|nr:hypothetical protein K461DRAFT_298099 [Myriangium duriaei CBS 260.36]